MAAKKKTSASSTQIQFDAIAIEGGLISPDWLSKIAQQSAGHQSESDYRTPKGLTLRDEIGRFYRMAQAHWQDFYRAGEVSASPNPTERFVRALLQDCFGFTSLKSCSPLSIDERSYPIGHSALTGSVPVVIGAMAHSLEALQPNFGEVGRRRSAFGLLQEYLNAQEQALWGIASNGLTLRIARDNASLTRPSWIEADLQRIFSEDRFADFTGLWLIAHESRFGREGQKAAECILEQWRSSGLEEGTRARDQLRRGVEDSLAVLGQGFVAHPDNQALRQALQDGTLSNQAFFNELLRLIYRVIFLLTTEDRGLLHADTADDSARRLYADGYSIKRLAQRALRRSAHDRHTDLWQASKIVFRSLAQGELRLGLPALAGLFSTDQCPNLDGAKLENRALLLAIFKLAWLRSSGALVRVNWRDMGPEELGSVYESLLELVPKISVHQRSFAFASGAETKGNARKTSGSYYTPDSLVQLLLDSALEPVIADTLSRNVDQPIDALLALSIVDPACGSGHFLLAAARRLAAHVARIQAQGTPSAAQYRHALRLVVGRCIFGVDLNPMAVELCKVSLWMEAVEPGLPLSFLDSHIQHGNALLGTTPELMAKGIPDAAWDPIGGDDKKVASALKKKNKLEQKAQADKAATQTAFDFSSKSAPSISIDLLRAASDLEERSDTDLASLNQKTAKWTQLLQSKPFTHERFVADAWCAAFVWPKKLGNEFELAPTHRSWLEFGNATTAPSVWLARTINELAGQFNFFHWHLQFPQVFAKGGFDVVLGNPPWDKIQPEEEAFFASRAAEIAFAGTSILRKRLISDLFESQPTLLEEWTQYRFKIEGASHFLKESGRFPLSSLGNLNLYRCFVELAVGVVGQFGRAGLVVQTALATGEAGKELFTSMMEDRRIKVFLDFENRNRFFVDVDDRFRFCLLTLGAKGQREVPAKFGWQLQSTDEAALASRTINLTSEDLFLFNPKSRTSPVFPGQREIEIARKMYERATYVCVSEEKRYFEICLLGELFNLTRDAKHFVSKNDASIQIDTLPLYEAKFIHQFDHRYPGADASHVVPRAPGDSLETPRRVDQIEVMRRLTQRGISPQWLIGFRRIASATNERTSIMAVLPPCAVGNTINLAFNLTATQASVLLAAANSFVFDFACRQKVTGTDVNLWIFEQLPIPKASELLNFAPWASSSTLMEWIVSRVAELTYTAWSLESFARELGYAGVPFRWDDERRFQIKCEIDAAFFHSYGLAREDVDFVMDTFPIVRKHDEKTHGEYRTKRVILDIYDALASAQQTGNPYRTPLDPLPAALGASHGVFASDGTPKDYAEALRLGLLFALIRRSSDVGISQGSLSRALLWLEDAKHAATGLQSVALAEFEQIRASDPLLAQGSSEAPKLLQALENEKAITRDAKGVVRLRLGSSIPSWLPQTPTLSRLANIMRSGLEHAEVVSHTDDSTAKEELRRA